MKKFILIMLLALVVLTTFVSCHDCSVCGKSKFCEKTEILGKTVYICKDCNVVDQVKKGVNDIKK